MSKAATKIKNEQLEISLLLEAVFRKYGYDFRDYAGSHIKRRLEHRKSLSGCSNYSEMLHQLIYDEQFFNTLLIDLSINVTEMFRDPWFYKAIRGKVIPHLKTYPFIKIWHAGCSTGQEVYSMAILLEEEGIQKRSRVYATDFDQHVLSTAKNGIYPLQSIKTYTENYIKAGGEKAFSDYYTADNENVILKSSLKEQILFSSHNLATDSVFGEMQMILCRNVLIYFNRELQERVVKLFHDSLCPGGFLCIGTKESLKLLEIKDKFEVVAEKERIYRKKR